MAARRHKALQLRVELLDIRPPIWRRIEIPSTYSFWDLHVAIQGAMGWMDCHLHEFTVAYRDRRRPIRIGVPSEDDELFGSEVQTEWQVPVTRYLGVPGDKCHYEYDFGDGWLHRVTLKKVHALQAGAKYPICTGGRRACPFEDCGGVSGYYQLLEALADENHEDHDEMVDWTGGGEYRPDHFEVQDVVFSAPAQRLKALKASFV